LNSKHLLDFVIEIGLEWLKIAPKKSKNTTMEFWKTPMSILFL